MRAGGPGNKQAVPEIAQAPSKFFVGRHLWGTPYLCTCGFVTLRDRMVSIIGA